MSEALSKAQRVSTTELVAILIKRSLGGPWVHGVIRVAIMLGNPLVDQATIAILTYHSLDDSGSALSTPPRIFAEQMQILYELGIRVVPISDARRVLNGTAPHKNLVAITFDDGFRSVYEWALPVLQRYNFTATVFLVTDYCGRTNAWPSQPLHVGRRSLLQWAEVREMSNTGITFGSHTRTHPDLRMITRRDAENEMIASKKAIEDATGSAVNIFAYPYGVYDETIKCLVAANFTLACSTAFGFTTPVSDPHTLERLDMYYLQRPGLFRHLFSPEVGAYIRLRRYLRDLRCRSTRWLNRLGHNDYFLGP